MYYYLCRYNTLLMFNNKPPTYIFVIAAILDAFFIILIFSYCL